mmetsp:Transcript_25808/g.72901  ORF Transcript_25808/g.72901 Transcript_25808/m.72901 type:complete len:165 (-) Transcript_25808:72-566(-)
MIQCSQTVDQSTTEPLDKSLDDAFGAPASLHSCAAVPAVLILALGAGLALALRGGLAVHVDNVKTLPDHKKEEETPWPSSAKEKATGSAKQEVTDAPFELGTVPITATTYPFDALGEDFDWEEGAVLEYERALDLQADALWDDLRACDAELPGIRAPPRPQRCS